MEDRDCAREGCAGFLCDRKSSRYGYICHSCFEELVELGINASVDEFMKTPAPDDCHMEELEIAEAMFNDEFPFQRD